MTTKPRTPGIVYAVLSVVMLLVLGAVAFSTRQPPPPTIAEFAPSAVEKIEDAPKEQQSDFGKGVGECPGGDCTKSTPSPTPEPKDKQISIDVPRVRHCVGDPPRQIEDPQSPPCVPYWAGDNGGTTWPGVTKDEIRIASPNGLENEADAARFFNKRFEFYGRKIVLLDASDDMNCDNDAPQDARSSAQAMKDQYRVFATTQMCGSGAAENAYTTELARLKILYSAHESPLGSEWARRFHPYLWQYPMEADGMFAHMGEWGCKRLAGGTSKFAGPGSQGKKRVFGVLLQAQNTSDYPLRSTELTERLKACGAAPKLVIEHPAPTNDPNVMLQFKSAHVTSIFCLCHMLDETVIGRAATAQAYFPEWMMSSYDLNHGNFNMRAGFPAEQREHTFGIAQLPMQVAAADWPGTWACNEIQCTPGEDLAAIGGYQSMLLLASGIQMAGPHLTPQTFAAALRKTVFPNPHTPAAAGEVGFDKDVVAPSSRFSAEANMPHGMTRDSIEWWWSEAAKASDGNGAMCYVSHHRYQLGQFPDGPDDVFFRGRCDTGGG